MPRISERFADSAIYLYSSERAAKEGQNAGGSGFLVHVPSSVPNMGHLYAVTNRHLVDGSDNGKFWTIRLTKKGGGVDCITTQKEDWLLHEDGDDVAILPVGMKDHFKWWSVPVTDFLDREGIEVYQIGYGDDIFLVGRLISQSGIERNTPVARFGTIALPADPNEPVVSSSGSHEAFLVECHSISGFSGSPVFLMTDRVFHGEEKCRSIGEYKRKRYGLPPQPDTPGAMKITVTSMDTRIGPLLLGVDFGHLPYWEDVYETKPKRRITSYEARANTLIAGVVPAWKIEELINTPKLLVERTREDEELKKKTEDNPNSFVLDAAHAPEESVFTRQDFESDLRKVTRRVEPSEPDAGTK
jgi:hypothetical protein